MTDDPPGGRKPRSTYEQRLAERRRRADGAARREKSIATGKLILLMVELLLLTTVVFAGRPSPAWLLLPPAAYLLLAIGHERAISQRQRWERGAAFFATGLARLGDQWRGRGAQGREYLDEKHPYAADLDLFGPGSLFEYLSTARTRAGEATLARWLLEPAPLPETRRRQRAIAELSGRLDLREDLARLGERLRVEVDPEGVAAWAAARHEGWSRRARWTARILTLALLATTGCWGAGLTGWWPLLIVLSTQTFFAIGQRNKVRRVIEGAERHLADLHLLSRLLGRLEEESFEDPELRRIVDQLRSGGRPPSALVARLARVMTLLDSRRNQIFAPLALALMWATHLAFALESWRCAHGPAVRRWLTALGEFEALASLATYLFEHPENVFPVILDEGEPLLEAMALGHPLIPRAQCVTNDLSLGPARRLLVISGSNMSGKSTLLRTVGVNLVLAMAGGPVRARSLRLTPLRVGASIRINDSLQEGSSRFFTEITRIKQIFDLLRDGPDVIFLLDELLQGTNSHDRLIGAEALIRGLLDRGAIGLLTTHDLALTEMTSRLGHPAGNAHFEDRSSEGRMVFDYRMLPGVVQRSNAIALMRAIGLDV